MPEVYLCERMISKIKIVKNYCILLILFCCISTAGQAQTAAGKMHFTVSMERPGTHYYHVEFEYDGVNNTELDLKMPAWTPGYYWLVNFAKNVVSFQAIDDNGKAISWNKTSKNTWHLKTRSTRKVKVSYDVYAFTESVADPFLDEGRGYISPAGLFMYIDKQLQHPVTVTVKPYSKWHQISTGLDAVAGSTNTFSATDFDVLYDCPILVGNQKILSFAVKGIPHIVAIEVPESIDEKKYIADLKQMVESASGLMGDIPYKHYSFIMMGEGRGGLEHRNSMAVFSGGPYELKDLAAYKRWLSFLSHEYFHLYNIKAIRPIALGPFDYEKENYTNMLWVSEGFTVYYEYLVLNRAGMLSRKECLDIFQRIIRTYENVPGHLFQSATESSFDTWIQFFNHTENTANTTISYYDKGCALGLLLDLKIRHETQNKKSLDDVMRFLYQTYYKEKKRGFTDDEFRQACESMAGTTLKEVFDYASTVAEIDYSKYLGYAGLAINTTPEKVAGAYLGAKVTQRGNELLVTEVEWNSPAWLAGVSAQDTLQQLNGKTATATMLKELLAAGKSGDKVQLSIANRSGSHEIEAILNQKSEKSFQITPVAKPTTLQAAILKSFLKE